MKRILMAAVFAGTAGTACAADFSGLQMVKASEINKTVLADIPQVTRGYIAENDPSTIRPIEWIHINGGRFLMGTDTAERGFENAKPVHKVTIKTFFMSKTAVTVEQYAECVDKGKCTEPRVGTYCNWGEETHRLHPVNCVTWDQADQYARFKGARLPSESEWEYAATSGGKNQKYPWGNDAPTCERTVMRDLTGSGCGTYHTLPVCSKPAGNTAQGLCDMTGNVAQWIQDNYKASYEAAPVDGGAFEAAGPEAAIRAVRGGTFTYGDPKNLRVDMRSGPIPAGFYDEGLGFRIAK